MLYNIKIGKTLKKDKKGKRGLHLIIYIYTCAKGRKREDGNKGGAHGFQKKRRGVLFPRRGRMFLQAGE